MGKIGLYFNREVGFFPSVQFSQSVFAASLVITIIKRNCILKHVRISFKPLQLWPPLNNLAYWDISLCGVLLEGGGPEIHNTVSALKPESLFLSCKGGCGKARHVYISVLLKSSIRLQLSLPFTNRESIRFLFSLSTSCVACEMSQNREKCLIKKFTQRIHMCSDCWFYLTSQTSRMKM